MISGIFALLQTLMLNVINIAKQLYLY